MSLTPRTTRADTDFDVGDSAMIAYANGDAVRLRTAPGYENVTITLIPDGTTVDVLDGTFTADDGTLWYQVSLNGETGYVVSEFLAARSGLYAGTAGSATTLDAVNLRTGPGLADAVITELPAGAPLVLTGSEANGFAEVSSDRGDGWVWTEYIGGTSTGSDPAASADAGSRYTNDSVNLRDAAGTASGLVTVLPLAVEVQFTGSTEGGFAQVTSDYGDGWIAY